MEIYKIVKPVEGKKTVTLYHGTVLTSAKKISSDGICVGINKGRELDFAEGFYFADLKTAKVLARKKARDNEKAQYTGEDILPVVLPLEVDIDYILSKENVLIFTKKDRKWLNFIFITRRDKAIPYGHDASVIIGPMADGAVDNVMSIFRRHPKRIVKLWVYFNFLLFSGFSHMQYVVKKQYLCDNGHIRVGLPIIFGKETSV